MGKPVAETFDSTYDRISADGGGIKIESCRNDFPATTLLKLDPFRLSRLMLVMKLFQFNPSGWESIAQNFSSRSTAAIKIRTQSAVELLTWIFCRSTSLAQADIPRSGSNQSSAQSGLIVVSLGPMIQRMLPCQDYTQIERAGWRWVFLAGSISSSLQ